ncbi:MAG TPA: lipopolysaccharide biosynthesis protein [Opitutaceae bacterium]
MKLVDSSMERFRRFSPRAKSVGLFFVSSIFARGIGALCQILQVPIAIKALGNEAFGLWISLMSISYLITFADFGLGQGTQNKLAEAFATDRRQAQRELFVSAFTVLTGIGALLFGVGSVVIRMVDFAHVFHIQTDAARAAAPGAVRMVLLFFCLNFPLGLGQRLSYARQKGWMHNLSQAAAGVASVIGIIIAYKMGVGLVGIIVVTQSTVVLANLVLLLVQFKQLGWMGHIRPRIHRETVRELMSLGGFFALQQVLTVVLFALPQVIISTSMGAGAVTSYNLAQRFFNVFAIVQGAFMLPLWPAYSEAAGRNEFGWIRRTLVKSLKATVVFTVLPMAVATFAARRLIILWVGVHADLPPNRLIWILFVWNAIVFLQQPFGYMLAGISEIRRITVYAIAGTIASAALMLGLVGRMGQDGVVLGLIGGFVPFYLVGAVYQSIRVLGAVAESRMQRNHELVRQTP